MYLLLSILLKIMCSLFIIFIGHQLWNYLKDNYSTKKTNYLVSSQIEKYKNIIQNIQESKESKESNTEFFEGVKNDLEDYLLELQN